MSMATYFKLQAYHPPQGMDPKSYSTIVWKKPQRIVSQQQQWQQLWMLEARCSRLKKRKGPLSPTGCLPSSVTHELGIIERWLLGEDLVALWPRPALPLPLPLPPPSGHLREKKKGGERHYPKKKVVLTDVVKFFPVDLSSQAWVTRWLVFCRSLCQSSQNGCMTDILMRFSAMPWA